MQSSLTSPSEYTLCGGPSDRWYVAATKVSREEFACQHLRRQDIETFLPLAKITVRLRKRLIDRRAAFFPGYLFVRLNIQEGGWRAVNNTRGIRSLIMAGEAPVPIDDGFVESLMAAADENGLIGHDHDLRIGDRVRVSAGPLTDLVGTLTRMDTRGRVNVLVEMLNGRVPITLARSDLAPAA